MACFIVHGLQSAYQAMGQFPGVGLALAVLIVVGFPVAARTRDMNGQLRQLAAPAALLVGSVVFITITATGRVNLGLLFAARSRYVHIIAAMTLPALAVSADAIARHFRWFFPIGLALFLVGIPGNVLYLAHQQRGARPVNDATRQMMLTIAHDPFARRSLTIARAVDPKFLPAPMTFASSPGKWLVATRDTGPITIGVPGKPFETLLCTQPKSRT